MYTLWQRDGGESIEHLLPRGRVFDLVEKLIAQVGQSKHGLGTRVLQAGHTGQGNFQRHGDLPLDLFSRRPWVLGDDLDNGRCWVGIMLHVDMHKGIATYQR